MHEQLRTSKRSSKRAGAFRRSPEFAAAANASARRSTSKPSETISSSGRRGRASSSGSKPFTDTLEWNEPFARWFGDGELNVSVNCLDRHVRDGNGDKIAYYFEGRAGRPPHDHLSRAARRRVPLRQRPARARHPQGRSRRHLHADDSRASGRDARLRAHRRGALGDLRRLLARLDRRPRQRRRSASRSSPPTAAGGAAHKVPLKRNCDIAMERTPSIRHCIVARRIGDDVFMHDGRDYWWNEVVAGQPATCEPERDERRRPALPALHERHDGQAQGHQAHDRRLPDARGDDAQARLRSQRRERRLTGAPPTSAG